MTGLHVLERISVFCYDDMPLYNKLVSDGQAKTIVSPITFSLFPPGLLTPTTDDPASLGKYGPKRWSNGGRRKF